MSDEQQTVAEYECWKCGMSLKDVPRPLTRHSLCPVCRIDLHVCRLCRHYALQYTGQCQHDRADHVTDKERANFCDYFSPRRGAFHCKEDEQNSAARSELDDLFSASATSEDPVSTTRRERAEEQANEARQKLDDLFGGDETLKSND